MKFWTFFFIYALLFLGVKSVWPLTGDFFLLAVVYFGFFEEERRHWGVVWLFGFLMDSASVSPFGSTLFSYSLVFIAIRLLRTVIFFRSLLSKFVWVAFFSLIGDWSAWLWGLPFGSLQRPFSFMFWISLWNAFANGLLGLFWLEFLEWLLKWIRQEPYGIKTRGYSRAGTKN